MSSGAAFRWLVFAAAALAVWKIAYEAGRITPAASTSVPADAMSPPARIRDAWQDIVRRSVPAKVAEAPARIDRSPLPDGPFAANIAELERRADNGDPGAAFALAKGFRACRFYTPPKDQAELQQRAEDEAVNTLSLSDQLGDFVQQKAREKGITLPAPIPKADSMKTYGAALAAETTLDANCRGVARADVDQWLTWYAKAAALGDPDAQVGYWREAFQDADITPLKDLQQMKAESAAALQQAVARGDWRALAAIGQVFESGYYDDPDPFMAHAYFFAAAQAPDQDIAVLPWMADAGIASLFSGGRTQIFLSRQLAATASSLDAEQLAQSEQLGAQLYAQCCAGPR